MLGRHSDIGDTAPAHTSFLTPRSTSQPSGPHLLFSTFLSVCSADALLTLVLPQEASLLASIPPQLTTQETTRTVIALWPRSLPAAPHQSLVLNGSILFAEHPSETHQALLSSFPRPGFFPSYCLSFTSRGKRLQTQRLGSLRRPRGCWRLFFLQVLLPQQTQEACPASTTVAGPANTHA